MPPVFFGLTASRSLASRILSPTLRHGCLMQALTKSQFLLTTVLSWLIIRSFLGLSWVFCRQKTQKRPKKDPGKTQDERYMTNRLVERDTEPAEGGRAHPGMKKPLHHRSREAMQGFAIIYQEFKEARLSSIDLILDSASAFFFRSRSTTSGLAF